MPLDNSHMGATMTRIDSYDLCIPSFTSHIIVIFILIKYNIRDKKVILKFES